MNRQELIRSQLNNCIKETFLNIGEKKRGKVRDVYELSDKLVLVSTDRQSAFDRILAEIPFKGQVLNLTSAWWFRKTKHIVDNHILDIPDPNVAVVKKCKVFPVEFVVRGYITGSTSTSAWVNYEKGIRHFCGNILPDGMKKNEQFEKPIITPTTKSDDHDRSISPAEIVAENLMTQAEWDFVSEKALELFRFGQATARQHGMILVDTKYEFGKDAYGKILLVDEIHTADSSRYWVQSTYEEKFNRNEEPDNIDKEFLRLWFKDNCDPYNDSELPPAPDELVIELSSRYIELYEIITGQEFLFPELGNEIKKRIENNVIKYLESSMRVVTLNKISESGRSWQIATQENIRETEIKIPEPHNNLGAVIIMSSEKDKEFADKITDELNKFGIQYHVHVASAHKQAGDLLFLIEKYKEDKVIFITIAGRSNALSGFVAGNSDKPVIACPPFVDKLDMIVNINSTLQMPSKVPVMTILEPGNVALAVKRISEL